MLLSFNKSKEHLEKNLGADSLAKRAPGASDTLGKARARSRGSNEQKKTSDRGPKARAVPPEDCSARNPSSSALPSKAAVLASETIDPAITEDAQSTVSISSRWAADDLPTSSTPVTIATVKLAQPPAVFSKRSAPESSAKGGSAGINSKEYTVSGKSPTAASPPTHSPGPLSHPINYRVTSVPDPPRSFKVHQRSFSSHYHRAEHAGYTSQAPLPHQIQPHFYSLPDPDFGAFLQGHASRDDMQRACQFDSLCASGDRASRSVENVILMGRNRGIDVFRIERSTIDLIGRLQGLRGTVIDARILAMTKRSDPLVSQRPLVVVIVHGPLQAEERASPSVDPVGVRRTSLVNDANPISNRGSSAQSVDSSHALAQYQTTVEVYSLSSGQHVETLFATTPAQSVFPENSPLFCPPPPIGRLRLDVVGDQIVVSSGQSGEVFIFRACEIDRSAATSGGTFFYVGKVWAAVRTDPKGGLSSPVNSSDSEGSARDGNGRERSCTHPLLALSHRWLAFVPAPRPMQSMLGTVMVHDRSGRAAAAHMQTTPPPPPITCMVDVAEGEGILNRVTREVAQEVMKGAKWVGDQGMQAWRNYWTRPSPPNEQQRRWVASGVTEGSPPHDQSYLSGYSPPQVYPPTHAYRSQQSVTGNKPDRISIVDLQKTFRPNAPNSAFRPEPIATFLAPLGCSFLSFSPEGLMLLSASRKGDIQFIWDLMRVAQWKSGPATISQIIRQLPQGPTVRQVARFSRMTVANIIDVTWSTPRGERIAIVTDKGTVHLFDLPSSAFRWPPPRRVLPGRVLYPGAPGSTALHGGSDDCEEATAASVSHAVSAAMKMVSNTAQPILSAAQRRRGSSGAGFGSISTLALSSNGLQGSGKYMAAGLSKSLGAASGTISHLRKLGDTRIHIPSRGADICRGSVRWLSGRDSDHIAVVGGGLVRIYGVGHRGGGKGDPRHSAIEGRATEMRLPPDDLSPGATIDDQATSFWSLQSSPEAAHQTPQLKSHPLSYAEIETSAPFQPFHTDRRVQILTFENPQDSLGQYPESWAFGEVIPASPLTQFLSRSGEDNLLGGDSHGLVENTMHLDRDDNQNEQIVTTARVRKRTKDTDNGALRDGFFEDDCEVLDFAADRV